VNVSVLLLCRPLSISWRLSGAFSTSKEQSREKLIDIFITYFPEILKLMRKFLMNLTIISCIIIIIIHYSSCVCFVGYKNEKIYF
jgi:hypothetical protein